jgi:hypothetical protein
MGDKNVNTEDFFVQLRPMMDKANQWTGAVDVNVVTLPDNPLDDDDYYAMLNLAKLVCSVVPVMEEDDDFRDKLEKWLTDYEADGGELAQEVRGTVVNQEGNVVYLNFVSNTEGNC